MAAIQLLNGVVKGFAQYQRAAPEHIAAIVASLKQPALLEFRDVPLRENLLLLIRTLMELYPTYITIDPVKVVK